MRCQEVEMMIPDLARRLEVDGHALGHVKECGRCGALLAEERKLTAGLAAWAQASSDDQAPDWMEGKLREAFQRRPAQNKRRWLPFAAAGSIAAAVLLAKLYAPAHPEVAPVAPTPVERIAVGPAPGDLAPVAPRRATARVVRRAVRRVPEPAAARVEIDFLPVAQGDGWTPRDGGRLVRVELPRSALRVFGLPMNEERASEQVQADVMLSHDGLLRAIRFVR